MKSFFHDDITKSIGFGDVRIVCNDSFSMTIAICEYRGQ